MLKNIVLFGGTFDPVHNGHLEIAESIAERCSFERITFVPTGRSPHKACPCASAEHRLAMLRLAIDGNELFDICEVELDRSGLSYTIDTLRAVREQAGGAAKLHWVIGADMLEDLPSWHRASEVIDMAEIITAVRPPWHERLGDIFSSLEASFTSRQVERLRERLVYTPLIDICSSRIRDMVGSGGAIGHLMPGAVCNYISEQGLYV